MSINLMSAIFRTEFRDLKDEEDNNTKASTLKFKQDTISLQYQYMNKFPLK